jgi:CRP/FNR family transcriptional regulator, anaerobic regulatory protein
MSKLIQALKSLAPLSEEDCNKLLNITSTVHLNKGDYWIESGNKNDKASFLEEGYLRRFYLKDGNEITDFFYFKNDFCADLPSIIGKSLLRASIIAMEDTTLTSFNYTDFNEICKTSPALEHLSRVIVEFTFLRFYNKTVSFILQTPEERYKDLFVTSPRILENAAQNHIASYIGINPERLSSLRAES